MLKPREYVVDVGLGKFTCADSIFLDHVAI
jgi:hypothetical protein